MTLPLPASSRPVFMLGTIVAACLLAACGGGSGGDPSLESAEARKIKTSPPGNSGSNSTPTDTSSGSTSVSADLLWSDPATWGGSLPPSGAEVVIPAGKVIVLDIDPPNLAGLRIEGTLRFARRNTALSVGYIRVTGGLEIGTAAAPFAEKAVITLTGAPQATNDGVSRGLTVQGGRLEIYGVSPSPVWTKLNDHANAGTTSLTLKDSTTNWRAGDTIAVAPTDWYGVAVTERVSLASASGTELGLTSPLAKFRWGKMQYVTSSGMSLTPEAGYAPPVAPAPTELDERAAVADLTRNIVIQGIDDAAWQTTGFGAHVMIMGLQSKVVVDGLELRRVGQAGNMGRYPFHWHMLSYDSAGTLLGDATGHVLKNSAIWNSSQRCVVIHGTNGVQVLNNVCQDIKGHAFFLEDAVERRNVIDGNLALGMRSPAPAQLLQKHEGPDLFEGGPAGFWLTNPDNAVRNNLAGDAQGNGFWMAFPRHALGLSSAVPMLPDRLPHGVFEYNTGHSSKGPGLMVAWAPIDAAGNVGVNQYIPTQDGSDGGARLRFELKRVTSYKNGMGAYRNVVSNPDYLEWAAADNVGQHFSGKVDDGTVQRGLFVGFSLNNASPYPTSWNATPPVAFATYHSMMSSRDNTVVNFPLVDGQNSGAFSTLDYYIGGVEKGTIRNSNNRLIASAGGYRVLSPNLGATTASNISTLSGALWDPYGYWGIKNNYIVFNVPFLTQGANCIASVATMGSVSRSCDGEYFGVQEFQTDFDTNRYNFTSPMVVQRLDPASGSLVGNWTVGTDGRADGFRTFAARGGAQYTVAFPGKAAPKWVQFDVTNAYRDNDQFLVAIPFDGSTKPQGYVSVGYYRNRPIADFLPGGALAGYARVLSPAASLNEVKASTGDRMWQDSANNLLWIKYRGGIAGGTYVPNSDADMYRTNSVVITAQ